jgi:uncharacterized protein YdbL (DUF1318 family)
VALAGCTPKVEVGVADEPIVINLNVEIRQEVRIRLEDDVKALLAREHTGVAERGVDAGALERAKQEGQIGERFDGYLGSVDQAGQEVAGLLAGVNARRAEAYQRIAVREAAPTDAVRLIAGEKRLEAADKGEWILEPGGSWRRK